MSTPRIAIIYYSTYGTNHGVAQTAAKAAEKAGAEVRLRRVAETAPADVVAGQDAWKSAAEAQSDIPEATLDDVDWADGLFFSSPTRFGTVTSQMRAFIDTLGPLWMEGKLAGQGRDGDHVEPEPQRRGRIHVARLLHDLHALGGNHRAAGLYRRREVRGWRQSLWILGHTGRVGRYRPAIGCTSSQAPCPDVGQTLGLTIRHVRSAKVTATGALAEPARLWCF